MLDQEFNNDQAAPPLVRQSSELDLKKWFASTSLTTESTPTERKPQADMPAILDTSLLTTIYRSDTHVSRLASHARESQNKLFRQS